MTLISKKLTQRLQDQEVERVGRLQLTPRRLWLSRNQAEPIIEVITTIIIVAEMKKAEVLLLIIIIITAVVLGVIIIVIVIRAEKVIAESMAEAVDIILPQNIVNRAEAEA